MLYSSNRAGKTTKKVCYPALFLFLICDNVSGFSLEQFKLEPNGAVIRVEIDLVLPDLSKKKLVKYLSRVVDSAQPEPAYIHSGAVCNNWIHVSNHSPKTLRTITAEITDCVDVITPSSPAQKKKAHSPIPSLTDSESNRLEPHTTRHFNGVLSEGEEVTLFTVQVRKSK
jgi:hypothetical protein